MQLEKTKLASDPPTSDPPTSDPPATVPSATVPSATPTPTPAASAGGGATQADSNAADGEHECCFREQFSVIIVNFSAHTHTHEQTKQYQ